MRKRTFSVMPGSAESSTSPSSFRRSMSCCTSSAGAEAPAVMPTDWAPSSHLGSSASASAMRWARTPCSAAISRSALAVLRRVANVLGVGADDGREALAQRIDHGARVVDAERGLGDEGELGRVADLEPRHFLGARDEMDLAIDAAHRALDLGMAGMADQDDLAALRGIALALAVHLGDERAGGIDHRQRAALGGLLDGARNAMGAEDGDAAGWDLVEFIDEMRALGAQPLDHVAVVDDLMAHIDRRTIFLERLFDDLDGPLDAGAEPSGLGQDDPHALILFGLGRSGRVGSFRGRIIRGKRAAASCRCTAQQGSSCCCAIATPSQFR